MSYRWGKIQLQGTPTGCTVTNVSNAYYLKIGKLVMFSAELGLTKKSVSENIYIPVLPFKTKLHSAFYVGYQSAVFKAYGTNSNSVLKAAAYGNSNELYFLVSYDGRMYNVTNSDLVTNGSIIVSGFYYTDE